MNVRSKGLILFSTLIILSMVLAACAPAAPETIIQTVEVMVEGTPVVQTQVVEVTAEAPVVEEEATGPILAEEGLIACNPIPVLPEAGFSKADNQIHKQKDAFFPPSRSRVRTTDRP